LTAPHGFNVLDGLEKGTIDSAASQEQVRLFLSDRLREAQESGLVGTDEWGEHLARPREPADDGVRQGRSSAVVGTGRRRSALAADRGRSSGAEAGRVARQAAG
jgi:hypothetical protein